MISEYLDIIAAPADATEVRTACMQHVIDEVASSEVVIGCTHDAAAWIDTFSRLQRTHAYYARPVDPMTSYQADLSAGFAAYLRSLGSSTRRSLWHLRRRLSLHGEVRFDHFDPAHIRDALDDLNALHLRRWGKLAFSRKRLEFHRQLAARLATRGELAFSRLSVDGRTVSVLYDVRAAGRQYNIKMAFDPTFDPRLSLGLLHLGFAIETAAERGVSEYDFLAGLGRTTDYKRHLAQKRRELRTVQWVRSKLLSSLYRWHDQRHNNDGAET